MRSFFREKRKKPLTLCAKNGKILNVRISFTEISNFQNEKMKQSEIE